MTCIVGVIDKETGTIYMGADSAGSSNNYTRVRADTKVFRNGPFLIGFTTSFRMGQLLMYNELDIRHQGNGEGAHEFMVSAFIPMVQDIFEMGGFMKKKDEVLVGGEFLVGYKSRLFCVGSDFQVGEVMDDYDVCGSGREYALGSLHSTKSLLPEVRVRMALEAAEYFGEGIRKPFNVLALVR